MNDAMKKIIIILFYIIGISIYAQTNSGLQAPEIIPKSPEVKGFERYGEFPVSEYTGVPSINIPLHTINLKDIEFPISLDYHAAGIQVTQEATWVGLGWNLMAGGSISITPVGGPDKQPKLASQEDWRKILNYQPQDVIPKQFFEEGARLWGCRQQNTVENKDSRTTDEILREALSGNGEQDIYNVSFLGYSFKFSIHPIDGRIVYYGEKNKFKVEKINTNWKITDELGIMYFFNATESYLNNDSYQPIVTWYLSDIIYQGKQLLKLNYKKNFVTYLPGFSESIVYHKTTPKDGPEQKGWVHNPPVRTYSYMFQYNQLYLSSIVGSIDSIVFKTKSRIDLENALALDELEIIDKVNKNTVKRYKFEYDYFTGTDKGAASTTNNYAIKRLILNEVYRIAGTMKSDIYRFSYNEIKPLPYKTSFSQDFWGFYNGQDNSFSGGIVNAGIEPLYANNRSLLPDPYFLSFSDSEIATRPDIAQGILKARGVNRFVDKEYITLGILNSITYPTGGKTVFVFEPNDFSNAKYPNASDAASIRQSKRISVINNGNPSFGTSSTEFEIKEEIKVRIKVIIKGRDFSADQMAPFTALLQLNYKEGPPNHKTIKYALSLPDSLTIFNQKKSITIEEDIILPVGTHLITAGVASMPYQAYDFVNGVQAEINYTEIDKEKLQAAQSIGGGVRIKEIINYKENNSVASVKRYTYKTIDDKTSGRLIFPLKFFNKYRQNVGISTSSEVNPILMNDYLQYRDNEKISSFNTYDYSVSSCLSKTVGYSRVTIETISSNSTNNGKEIVEFINAPSMSSYWPLFFYPRTEQQYTNGKVSQKIILNQLGDTVYSEKNTYAINNFEYNVMNVNVRDKYVGPTGLCVTLPGGVGTPGYDKYIHLDRFVITVYPTINYTVQLTKKEELLYSGSNKVGTETTYEYDLLNYKPKKITKIVGTKKKINEYKYTLNYGSGEFYVQAIMAAQNMISIPIEEFNLIDTNPIQAKKTDFLKFGSMVLPTTIYIKNGSGTYEPRLEYQNYDNYGNPLYITKDDADKVVYLYSYNSQYPIAEIKNATLTEVTAVLSSVFGVSTADALSALTTPNEAKLKDGSLQKALPNALVTTYTYKPLVGILTATDPSGITTYYDYDSFGRLKETYLMEGGVKKVVQSYNYHYQNQ
jgi:YD repeat-containing protein